MLQPRLTPRQVGYCQGMAFIAAVFLSYMPEEVRGRAYQHATLLRRHAPPPPPPPPNRTPFLPCYR